MVVSEVGVQEVFVNEATWSRASRSVTLARSILNHLGGAKGRFASGDHVTSMPVILPIVSHIVKGDRLFMRMEIGLEFRGRNSGTGLSCPCRCPIVPVEIAATKIGIENLPIRLRNQSTGFISYQNGSSAVLTRRNIMVFSPFRSVVPRRGSRIEYSGIAITSS
jgi:hypothetical protein